jgi:creatinine amidohydrolase
MAEKYMEYMTTKPAELKAYIENNPITYIPFGALEWHGEHMVVGNDSLKATWICQKCAEITGGVLFPCVNWGAFDTVNFPFTFHFSRGALKKITSTMMDQLYSMGFRIVVLLTGHYPGSQIKNVKKAAQKFTKKYKDGFALGIPEQALVADLGYIGDHAAEWETSMLMAINPEWVDLSRVGQNLTFSERCARHAIMGRDPTKYASLEKGQKILQEIINRLTTAVLEVKKTQSAEPFNQIYKNFDTAFKEMFNLRHPLTFDKLYELQGIENKHEMWNYVKWKFFRGGKQRADYKS